ncbi:MAG: hypothetical protein KF781_08720 [Chitinophagaceae bacterium]|nr:hypothetical protein [Chitinophagaceae bacterium]MCW5905103.1 hypothetical protein [Chitinophagaceae bacterium]
MRTLFIFLTVSFATSIASYAQRDSLWSQDDISNVTVFLYQEISDMSAQSGSGTIINHNGKYFLLTANHVAKEMRNDAKVVFRIAGDKPGIVDLLALSKTHSLKWTTHPIADLSLMELATTNKEIEQRLKEWSFPSYLIYGGRETAPKDVDITFLGYPLLDLQLEHFSPLIFTSHLASGLITQRRADTKTKCTFFYLDLPSMQGCSGSGVYYSVKKAMFIGGNKTIFLGVVHGTQADNTGGKLAAITPSYYIWDILKD